MKFTRLMGIKIIFYFLSSGALVITLTACHGSCAVQDLHFNNGYFYISPVSDSIKVGDTLHFTSEIPIKMKYQSGSVEDSSIFDFSGAKNVSTILNFYTYVDNDTIIEALDSFTYLQEAGNFTINSLASNASKTINFQEMDTAYKFSIGIIANKKGVYSISIIDIYKAEIKCSNISISIAITNTIDQHFDYIQNFNGGSIDPYELAHTYCFKVY